MCLGEHSKMYELLLISNPSRLCLCLTFIYLAYSHVFFLWFPDLYYSSQMVTNNLSFEPENSVENQDVIYSSGAWGSHGKGRMLNTPLAEKKLYVQALKQINFTIFIMLFFTTHVIDSCNNSFHICLASLYSPLDRSSLTNSIFFLITNIYHSSGDWKLQD